MNILALPRNKEVVKERARVIKQNKKARQSLPACVPGVFGNPSEIACHSGEITVSGERERVERLPEYSEGFCPGFGNEVSLSLFRFSAASDALTQS